VTPGSRRLLFTNESGQQANGHILWYGNRIVASSRGNLQGQVNGNVIQWANGAYWTR
jgi:hypothetical protein